MPASAAPPALVVRADGGGRIGGGHLMRCVALIEAWRAAGGRAHLLSQAPPASLQERLAKDGVPVSGISAIHPQKEDLAACLRTLDEEARREGSAWLALDGYHFDAAYAAAVGQAGHRVLVLDDAAHLERYHADVLLNPNVHARDLVYRFEREPVQLFGTPYLPLRREFHQRRREGLRPAALARRLLVTLGAADPCGATLRVLEGLSRSPFARRLATRVVVGSLNPSGDAIAEAAQRLGIAVTLERDPPDMAALMAEADVAISAAGGSAWELACLGVPSLLVVVAQNQRGVATALEACGAARNLGPADELTGHGLGQALETLASDPLARERSSRLGRRLVDGLGAERAARALGLNAAAGPRLRRAGPEDAALLWEWASDPGTRLQSFRPEPIAWSGHLEWLDARLGSEGCRIWILEEEGVPLGSVRYDAREAGCAAISFSVARGFRGRGVGTRLLLASWPQACAELGVGAVEGVTFADNPASARAFVKAGFERQGEREIAGRSCLVFRRACPVGAAAPSQ